MNRGRMLLNLVVMLFAFNTWAQTQNDQVVFTINETPYYAKDFMYMYHKNRQIHQDSKEEVQDYLPLYIDYKLKVLKAQELGLDTLSSYKQELALNRGQLAQQYLTNPKVTDSLVKQAFDRSRKEIRASHILFLLDPNASENDSLKVYNKAMEVREQIHAGRSFTQVAKLYSEDPSVVQNGGDLGYFSVFKMVYPFETGAYNTSVGQVSLPIRSQFGYHLIQVTDKRDTRTDLSIAHIMLLKDPNATLEQQVAIERRIYEIYKRLEQGADFSTLVKQYSEDRNTKDQQGIIPRFASGSLGSPILEDAAYALKEPNQISEPIQTDYAWHIVKLVKKYPLADFQSSKSNLLARVKRDARSKIIDKSVVDQLKSSLNIQYQDQAIKDLATYFTDQITTNSWEVSNVGALGSQDLVILDDSIGLTRADFFDYAFENQLAVRGFKSKQVAVQILFEEFLNKSVKRYYMDNLESFNVDFRSVMQEYKEGLLVFDLMQEQVWQKAKQDTLGYKAYYAENLQEYTSKERALVHRFNVVTRKEGRGIKKLLKQGKSKTAVLNAFSPEQVQGWIVDEKMEDLADLKAELNLKKLSLGVYEINDAKEVRIIQVQEILPESIMEMQEVLGRVKTDYQNHMEQQYIEGLRKDARIKTQVQIVDQL